MALSPKNNEKKKVFYTGKLYGLTGILFTDVEYCQGHDLMCYRDRGLMRVAVSFGCAKKGDST